MGIIFEKLIEIQCLIFLKFIHLHLLLFEVTLNVVVWQHMLELPSSLESSGPPALDSRWCHPKWRPFSFGFSAAQENTWVNAELQVVMGPGHKFLTRIGSNFWCSGRVRSAIFDLSLGLENFPHKWQIIQFFALQIKKYPGQSRVGLLFTEDQKLQCCFSPYFELFLGRFACHLQAVLGQIFLNICHSSSSKIRYLKAVLKINARIKAELHCHFFKPFLSRFKAVLGGSDKNGQKMTQNTA